MQIDIMRPAGSPTTPNPLVYTSSPSCTVHRSMLEKYEAYTTCDGDVAKEPIVEPGGASINATLV